MIMEIFIFPFLELYLRVRTLTMPAAAYCTKDASDWKENVAY